VLRFTQQGWPNDIKKDDELQPFYTRQDEISIVQGVLMWGVRVIVPAVLRRRLLDELHSCHTGKVRMKSLACQFVWWPNIDSEIEQIGKSCIKCGENRPNTPSAPLHPWQFPETPWSRLHMDLAGPFLNRMYLIVVDAHSKWPEVFCLNNNTTSANVIYYLRETYQIWNSRPNCIRQWKAVCFIGG
jgi:hypothetical protein